MDNTTFDVNHSSSVFTYGYIRIPDSVLISYNIFLSLAIVFGIAGNLLVILVFAKYKPATAADVFIVFIAVFDFLSSSINVPVYLSLTTGLWKFIGSDILCKVHMFLSQTVVLTSTFLICGLALERCHKVCYRGSVRFSIYSAKCSILLITLLTILLSTPCLIAFTKERGNCYARMAQQWVFVYFLFVFLTFVIATCVVVISYTKIVIAVKGSEANMRRHQARQSFSLSKSMPSRLGKNKIGTMETVDKMKSCYNRGGLEQKLHAELFHAPTKTAESYTDETAPSSSYLSKAMVKADVWAIQTSSSEELACDVNKARAYHVSNGIRPINDEINIVHKETTNENHCNKGGFDRGKNLACAGGKGTSMKTTKIAFLVCVIFITTWVPPWCVFFATFVSDMNSTFVMFSLFGRMTYLLNTFTNPFLYIGMNHRFKGKLVNVLKCR